MNVNIPAKCWQCLNFSGAYCDVHQHLIEDCEERMPKSEDCAHWLNRLCTRSVYYEYCCGKDNCGAYNPKHCDSAPEYDLRISVGHLREVLTLFADGINDPTIHNVKVEDIIERVKREI